MNGYYGSDPTSKEIASGLRDFLDGQCDIARLRESWQQQNFDRALWQEFSELGFCGALLPEEAGGLGVKCEEIVSSLEEFGYSGASLPLADTVAVIIPIIENYGNLEQREKFLPGLISGETIGASTVMVGSNLALFAPVADVLLYVHKENLYALSSDQFVVEPANSPDPLSYVGQIKVHEDALNDETRLAIGARDEAIPRATWAAAAVLNGVSRKMLDVTVEHAKTREQFGKPIGSFQAVKHMIADSWVAVESSRPTSWYAAHASDENLFEASTASSVAKAAASEAAELVSDVALQVHGGIGFTWEHPLHFWLKKAKMLENFYGSKKFHLQRVGRALRDEEDQNGSNVTIANA